MGTDEIKSADQDHPIDGPNPLSYESPREQLLRDPPANVLKATAVSILGVAISTVAIALPSALLFMVMFDLVGVQGVEDFQAKSRATNLVVAGFFLVFFAMSSVRYWRLRKKATTGKVREWLVMGLLIGVGVACLLEGACFALLP